MVSVLFRAPLIISLGRLGAIDDLADAEIVLHRFDVTSLAASLCDRAGRARRNGRTGRPAARWRFRVPALLVEALAELDWRPPKICREV